MSNDAPEWLCPQCGGANIGANHWARFVASLAGPGSVQAQDADELAAVTRLGSPYRRCVQGEQALGNPTCGECGRRMKDTGGDFVRNLAEGWYKRG